MNVAYSVRVVGCCRGRRGVRRVRGRGALHPHAKHCQGSPLGGGPRYDCAWKRRVCGGGRIWEASVASMTKRLENNIMIMMCCPQVLREAAALMGEGDGTCSRPRARTMHYYNSATRACTGAHAWCTLMVSLRPVCTSGIVHGCCAGARLNVSVACSRRRIRASG